MQFILPEVLSTAKGLSVGAAGSLLFFGWLLWALGWRWHRFWIVFGMTLAAGILGLNAGQTAGGRQVMVVGVLLAVSVGMMALEVAKILAFFTGGVAAWVGAQSVYPLATELWAMFLCGGLLGIVLYRFWTMLTMSLLGVLISSHALMVLLQELLRAPLADWTSAQRAPLNGGVVVLTVLGVVVQAYTSDSPGVPKSDAAEEPEGAEEETPVKAEPAKPAKPAKPQRTSSSWWQRKAG